jgi:transcriptional regulator with XRE-family HTH domain
MTNQDQGLSESPTDALRARLDSTEDARIVQEVLEASAGRPAAGESSAPVTRRTSSFTYRAYVASALTGLATEKRQEVFTAQEKIKGICAAFGIHAHLPKDVSDPVRNPDLSAPEVFRLDRDKVLRSDLLILLTHEPSFGAGQELEFARQALIPIVLIIPGGKQVSRMVLGIPSTIVRVSYDTLEELALGLSEELTLLKPILENRALAFSDRELTVIGPNVRRLREECHLTQDELATALGISVDEVRHIEDSPDHLSNPSILLLRKLATVLKVDLVRLLVPDYDELIVQDVSHALEAIVAPEGRKAGSGFQSDSKKLAIRVARRLLERAS